MQCSAADFTSTWRVQRWRKGETLRAKRTDLASFPECLTDPAASSGLAPSPCQSSVPLTRRCYMITVGLCRGKNVLLPRWPGPSRAQPSLLILRFSKVRPLPSLLVIEQSGHSVPMMTARDYLSLLSLPKQHNAIIQAEVRRITDVNSNLEVQMYFFPPFL